MQNYVERLYQLLPALYRERDAKEGEPLAALLRILGSQADLLERDVRQLWDDFFIETCRDWVVPYIGDLVSNRLLFDSARLPPDRLARALFPDLRGPDLRPPIAIRTRADVAKTISFRRRKGTLPMLEEMARDVTGWPAHAVEMFELLGWNQHLEHHRPQAQWAELRSAERNERVDGAFDAFSHTVDVRRIAQDEGWHNVPNAGFFLFRLQAYELERVPARRAASAPWRYHMSPLGNPTPLFRRWRREGDVDGLATELHVPGPIRRAFFFEDLRRFRRAPVPRPHFTDLYGAPDPVPPPPPLAEIALHPDASFFVLIDGEAVLPDQGVAPFEPQIVCRRLDPWPAAQPAGRLVGVDPSNGRLVLGAAWGAVEAVDVFLHYGFPADVGGGTYPRHPWLVRPELYALELLVQESGATPGSFTSVADALAEWVAQGRPDCVIQILDSRTYALPASIQLAATSSLVIEAADGQRPLLQTVNAGLAVGSLPPAAPDDPRRGELTLSGVVVEGHLRVTGDLARLRLLHGTLVPGRRLTEDGDPVTIGPSLVVDGGPAADPINTRLRIELAATLTGPIQAPEHAVGIWVLDGIVDGLGETAAAITAAGGAPGPDLHLERATVFGRIGCRSLEMSESIATGLVEAVRTQSGCVRFSYVRPGSHTPRRFRCQPDLAKKLAVEKAQQLDPATPAAVLDQIRLFQEARVVPAFVATRYGEPPYFQLRLSAPLEIREGAEDGSEMGVYCQLKQPQREDNLRLRLEEYLPFGLEAGIIYAT